MQVVAVEDQCQVSHIKKHFTLLVTQSTFVIIGFNDLMTVIITKQYIYKIKISELLKPIPESLPPKKGDDYKGKKTIREVGREWFIKNMNEKSPHIKRGGINKIEQIKVDK